MRIAHVVHTALQANAHYTRTLTNRFQGGSEFNFRGMITLEFLLHDVLMELGKDLWCQDVLSEYTVKFLHPILVSYAQELFSVAGLGFLLHHGHIEDGMLLVFPDT